MASYTVVSSKHATLTGTTADTITFQTGGGVATQLSGFEILNKSGAADLNVFFAIGTTPTVATANADNSIAVPPGGYVQVPCEAGSGYGGALQVSVVGNGNSYSIGAL